MRITVWQLGVTVGLIVLTACAGGDGDGDGTGLGSGPPSGELTPERFERALAEAACEAAELCNLGTFTARVRADGRCVDALLRYISGSGRGLARLRAAVRYGELSFDASAARACLDSFEGRCPQAFDLLMRGVSPLAWCPEAFPGDCHAPDKLPWTAPLALGAQCDVTGSGPECAVGLACSFASETCQPCAPGDEGVECGDLTEALTAYYLTDRPEGSSCEYENALAPCNAGLVCNIGGEAVVCVTPRRAGMECPDGSECAGVCGNDSTCRAGCD